MSDLYVKASTLADAQKFEDAWKITSRMLIDNPNDHRALVTGAFILKQMGHLPQSYHMNRTAVQLNANDWVSWANFGSVCALMCLHEEAERYYFKSLKLARKLDDQVLIWTNLCALYVDTGEFRKGEVMARKILEADPENKSAKANIGFCQLANRNWEGWKGYHLTIGSDWRTKVVYDNEPEWDGSPGKTVALYSDQGLGDEISFASVVPDAEKVCKKLILDCDKRLEGLFRRSFPGVKVYGTRGSGGAQWDKEDWEIDASLPLGQIGEFFRTKDADFPGTPYLIPCPDRRKMWQSVFMATGKPVIGIAWTGGVPKSNARNRRLGLEDFLPLFQTVDAHYVSLQYKDATDEIAAFLKKYPEVDLKQYTFGTLTKDYDDTAAMIAAMDHVVCIQTAVAHTAGALGTPVTVLVPVATQWRYGLSHDTVPWYGCLRVIRQEKSGSWRQEIGRASKELGAHFAGIYDRAGDPARDDGLRDQFRVICPDSVRSHQPNGSHAPA